ncbi:hypothetical protein BHE74_00014613 [Ensete ventricosum]|nr:hypothetical protein BHE74_00014613 [Ensete ventricosum]
MILRQIGTKLGRSLPSYKGRMRRDLHPHNHRWLTATEDVAYIQPLKIILITCTAKARRGKQLYH